MASETETSPTESAHDRAQAAISNLVNEMNLVVAENERKTLIITEYSNTIHILRGIITELYKAYSTCPVCAGDVGQHAEDCEWVQAVLKSEE
jgi:hypothetical protein